jgi:hypothetical protein
MQTPATPERILRVVVTMESTSSGWHLLAPGGAAGGNPRIGRCEIRLNPERPVEADYWIVFANARPCDRMHCAPENTLFIAAEPEEKKVYPLRFYRQFHRIIDTHTRSGHPRITLHAPCMSWHVGYNHRSRRFDIGHHDLSALRHPAEIVNKVSVVCSDAAFTSGQRERLAFLTELKRHLGPRLVHFGRGFRPVDDKLDAILGYRCHLVLENCRAPHYWTEKISDAYLGWTFPFYSGCPNLADYFPQDSFEPLDPGNARDAAQRIIAKLDSPAGEDERQAVAEARRRVLYDYNPWVAWARWAVEYHQPEAAPVDLTLRSHKAFRPFPRGLFHRILHRMDGMSGA